MVCIAVLVLIIWSTRVVKVAVVDVEDVTLHGIMKSVTFTNVVLNKEAIKLVPNAKNFRVQFS